jgi:hypothetical protein
MTLLDPPIFGEELASGLPVLLIAMDLAGSSCVFLVVDMEGLLSVKYDRELKTTMRYDLKKKEWYDNDALAVEDDDDD